MHLHVIVCFALVIWYPDQRPILPYISSTAATLIAVWVQPLLLWAIAASVSAIAVRRIRRNSAGAARGQQLYHRGTTILRMVSVGGFAASLFLTDWVNVVRASRTFGTVPGLSDFVIVLPFFAAAVLLFVGLYRVDRTLHELIVQDQPSDAAALHPVWSLGQYLNFNLRHHLLVVAVPMSLILIAFGISRAYADSLNQTFRVAWAAEVVPAVAAAIVFLVAPVMLRYIWPTSPLPDGPLRRQLGDMASRIGFRYRDILVWHSGGMMINAAVMGLFRPVRYVLLSDGLLESMTDRQIEAVFGHEVGHIRHRHIQYFLLFAVCSMLILLGLVEGLRVATVRGVVDLSIFAMQGIGFGLVMVVWGFGFGWISRRFERQADLFGVACVTPPDRSGCPLPCSVHDEAPASPANVHGVCASAVGIFASALERVASLNGIPREERSWRHSSIANRVRFLVTLTGDPARAAWFDRLVRRIKISLFSAAVVGSVITAMYVWRHPIYGVGAVSAGGETDAMVQPAGSESRGASTHARKSARRQSDRGTHPRAND